MFSIWIPGTTPTCLMRIDDLELALATVEDLELEHGAGRYLLVDHYTGAPITSRADAELVDYRIGGAL